VCVCVCVCLCVFVSECVFVCVCVFAREGVVGEKGGGKGMFIVFVWWCECSQRCVYACKPLMTRPPT
jgi:hypothetical protein